MLWGALLQASPCDVIEAFCIDILENQEFSKRAVYYTIVQILIALFFFVLKKGYS